MEKFLLSIKSSQKTSYGFTSFSKIKLFYKAGIIDGKSCIENFSTVKETYGSLHY